MSFACEAEVCVQNEHALSFSVISEPAPVLEYIKAIAAIVGASHILAVFEESDKTIKVYFDDKKYADTLIRSGIHVMGHHIRVDYVVPPGRKVILSNIDPVISNFDLVRLLSIYGTIVSPVIRPPISDDTELCHIDYGVRYVYMLLNGSIPNCLEFKYGDQLCTIKIKVDSDSPVIPVMKTENFGLNYAELRINVTTNDAIAEASANDASVLDNSDPVVVSVQSAASDTNAHKQFDASKPSAQKRNYVKRKGRSSKTVPMKRTKITPTSRAAKRIKQNVKHKWMGVKNKRAFRKGERRQKLVRQVKNPLPPSPPTLSPLSPAGSSVADVASAPPLLSNGDFISNSSCKNILSDEELNLFLVDVKHRKAPMELVKKYLGYYNSDMLLCLIEQLSEYKHKASHHSPSLRMRIKRLIKTLKESL